MYDMIHPIMCWNVRGLNNPAKRTAVGEMAAAHRIAILCIQETKIAAWSPDLVREIGGAKLTECIALPAIGTSGGAAILWDKELAIVSSHAVGVFAITARVTFLGQSESFWISSVYDLADDARKEDFLRQSAAKDTYMATSMSCLLVLCLVCPFLVGVVRANPWYGLFPQFYDHSCPKAKEIVQSIVAQAVAQETRMAASLVRLHFHDCFVKGCDASVLLDNSSSIVSEKGSNPNLNSLRGFEVVDQIKVALETACPGTVSCADILALAARDSTVLVGGPYWDVPLGRRDSLGASIQGSNNDIPAPNNTLPTIITKFKRLGLNVVDVVALSAKAGCPRSGGDNNLFPLDVVSSTKFDNFYFKNILAGRGLLSSDEVLLTKSAETAALVKAYANDVHLFFQHFAQSMVNMGNIMPLTGSQGEIRKDCRRLNNYH
ncbi:Peroxidase 15 [Hordeum vulgare]|nr:Peroxidase 15 [Hordeum vulgare]